MYEKVRAFSKIVSSHSPNAKMYLVGGCVRDAIMNGMNFNHPSIKDMDIEIYDVFPNELEEALKSLNIKFDVVGTSFGVYKIHFEGETFDVAFPRTEEKTGVGYTGFEVKIDPFITPYKATLRRDLTINAIMWDLENEEVVDFHLGERHIRKGLLHPVGKAFGEDPLRVLRVFQFLARFGFSPSSQLIHKCGELLVEKQYLTIERVWIEWEKWCLKSKQPSKGIVFLKDCGWLDGECASLVGIQQSPKYHPEGDVFQHTLHVIDAANAIRIREKLDKDESIILMLAAICHDFGKNGTTKFENGDWTSHGHAEFGVEISASFLEKIGCPLKYRNAVLCLVREHMVHFNNLSVSGVRRLVNRLVDGETTLKMLGYLIEADCSGRPPLEGGMPETMKKIIQIADDLKLDGKKKIAPEITGKDLISLGFQEGKELGDVLKELYQKQLDGENVRKKYLGVGIGYLVVCFDDFRGFIDDLNENSFTLRYSPVVMQLKDIDWINTIKTRLSFDANFGIFNQTVKNLADFYGIDYDEYE